jgi:pyruvate,orthophosphate dikinase
MQDNFDEKFHPGCPVFDQRSKKMAVTRRAVLLPTEGAEATLSPDVRGGKGANLADMAALRLPVPPFFTIPTGICRAYMEHGELPKRTKWHLERGIAELEKATGREFGSPNNPLLVSVRSGAPVSMPGMMDTVLNVGMTQKAEDGLAAMGGEEFATDILIRFLQSFGCHGWPDVTPWEQLNKSITDVLDSWNSERAKTYRDLHDIPDWIGTAVNVQAMVFGNLDDNSGTGVAFSTNPSTGEDGMFGEWLSQAQGEDIVSGARTPEPICNLAAKMPAVYAELEGYVEMLSAHVGGVADVEFTVEAGKLYVLQVRRAKVSPVAAATMAVRAQWAKQISREEAVASLTEHQIRQLRTDSFSPRVLELAMHHYLVATGLPASPGAAVGLVVYSSQEAVEAAKQGIDVVLVRPDTSPDDLLGMLAAKAIVTGTGGMTCHAAMVASAQGIPAVVGVGELPALWPGAYLSVDATNGRVFQGQLPLISGERTKEVNIFLKWAAQMKPSPSLDFSLLEQRFCMNQVLNGFYLAKRMAQASAGSSLEGEAAELWRKIREDTAVLIGTYLAVALSGELRHFYDNSCENPLPETREKAEELFGKYVGRTGSDRYLSQMSGVERLSQVGLTEQIRFAQLAADIFSDPGWPYGIGGEAWAAIAQALLAYLDGSWEFTTFVDHAFDLRHNGNALFNKHAMVTELTTYRLEPLIPDQLNDKKNISDVRALHNKLGAYSFRDIAHRNNVDIASFGDDVMEVWSKGERLGLW